MSTQAQNSPKVVLPSKPSQPLAGPGLPRTSVKSKLVEFFAQDAPARRDVQVQLQYLANDPIYDHVKPLQITPNFMDTEKKTNVRLEPGTTETLHDIRGRFSDFALDANGFQYIHAPTPFTEWSSQPAIGQTYLAEMESLLRNNVTDCDEILFYDARIRQAGSEGLRVEGLSYNPFARQVHTDNTPRSAIEKIRNLTEMKADYLLSGRCRIINIWRPIKHPVYDCGLAVADGASLKPSDVIECERYRQDTKEFWDTMGVVKYRPDFNWYYMSSHHQDDVILFKNYDSDTSVPAPICLHTAFDLPASEIPLNAPTRESIEVRALVFTYPTTNERRLSNTTLSLRDTALPHPLAVSLQRSDLKRIDDNGAFCAVDRLRKDIDEAKEVKDAELLLRKRKIRSLEQHCDSLIAERDTLQSDLSAAEKQISVLRNHTQALEDRMLQLEARLGSSEPDLREQIRSLEAEVVDVKVREVTRLKDERDGEGLVRQLYGEDGERMVLLQQVEAYKREAERWKSAAMAT